MPPNNEPNKRVAGFTDEVVGSFEANKLLKSNGQSFTSLDFDDSGQFCLTANINETIGLWDVKLGQFDKIIPSKKYGCKLARFTHSSSGCVYASSKGDDTIRYVDLKTKNYVRYFEGHKGKVTSLEVSSVDDTFISADNEGVVRIWDLKSRNCEGQVRLNNFQNEPLRATLDPSGLVFAVLSPGQKVVDLFDIRHYTAGPFLSFECNAPGSFTKIEFSNDNKHILVVTDSSSHHVYDSYKGEPVATLQGFVPLGRKTSSQAAFSVDGNYIFGSCADRKVAIWKLGAESGAGGGRSLQPWKTLQSPNDPNILAFCPKSMMLVTADDKLALWQPTAGI